MQINSKKRILGTSCLAKPDFEDFLKYSDLFIQAGQYSNNGPCLQLLEMRLAEFHKSRYCIAFANGFWALVMTIEATKLNGKTEILIPSLTYRRMADLVSWAGLSPVYYDIDPMTLTGNSQLIESKISENTSAILGVHPIVNCFPTEEVKRLCNKYDLPFIMDSVESAYECQNGKRVGSQAVAEVFSMHASKLINGCEGGYVTTSSADLYEQLLLTRGFGFKGPENIEYDNGVNAKLNEMHAAFALSNLDLLEQLIHHNKEIYMQYKESLESIKGLKLLEFNDEEQTSYKNIVVKICDDFPIDRDELVLMLNNKSILARSYYHPPLHTKENNNSYLPYTDLCSKNHLILPSGYQINVEDIQYICSILGGVS